MSRLVPFSCCFFCLLRFFFGCLFISSISLCHTQSIMWKILIFFHFNVTRGCEYRLSLMFLMPIHILIILFRREFLHLIFNPRPKRISVEPKSKMINWLPNQYSNWMNDYWEWQGWEEKDKNLNDSTCANFYVVSIQNNEKSDLFNGNIHEMHLENLIIRWNLIQFSNKWCFDSPKNIPIKLFKWGP